MKECKHGLKQGCYYCHRPSAPAAARQPRARTTTRVSRLSEKMNDRMTSLNRRLKELRGQ